jgi:hypothetical protein
MGMKEKEVNEGRHKREKEREIDRRIVKRMREREEG